MTNQINLILSIKLPLLYTAQNNFGLTQHPVKQTNFTRTCPTAPSVVSLSNYPALLSLERKKWKWFQLKPSEIGIADDVSRHLAGVLASVFN